MNKPDPIVEILKSFWDDCRAWPLNPDQQIYEKTAQALREAILAAEWTEVVDGDESTPPGYGDYLVEVLNTEGGKYYMISEYLPNINYWQEIRDDDKVTHWQPITPPREI